MMYAFQLHFPPPPFSHLFLFICLFPFFLFCSVIDSGVGSARFGLSVPEIALLLEGLEGAVDANKYIFGLLRRKKKSKKTLEKEASAKLAKETATTSIAAATVAHDGATAAAASAAVEDDSPSRKRAKLASTGEFASPEPEQPEESMMSPDGPGGDVPSPQAASPIVVDLSALAPQSKKAAPAAAAAASGTATSALATSGSAAASRSSTKRKAGADSAAAVTAKKQKGILAFFGN